MIASTEDSEEQSLTVNAAYCRTEEVPDLVDLKDTNAYARLIAGEEVVAYEDAWKILQGTGFLATLKVESYVGLPLVGTNGQVIGLMLAVGKAAKPAQPKPGQLPLEQVVVRDKYPARGPA